MAINRARLRGIMGSGGIAAEPPALEFTEALDEEIEESQGGLATIAALEASQRNQIPHRPSVRKDGTDG